jgi:predicted nucleotidyltransferase
MGAVSELALELGAPERTLRRAVALGTVRSRRLSARRLRLADGELDYLRGHWELLSELRSVLRTRPEVRLAVLFGSMARGDGDVSSDLDLLVEFGKDRPLDLLRLAIDLEAQVDRRVDVAKLSRAEQRDPFFLLQALDDGRVIVDRDKRWPDLRGRRAAIYRRATRSHRRQMQSAAAALNRLTTD